MQTDPNWAVPSRAEPYRTMQWKSAIKNHSILKGSNPLCDNCPHVTTSPALTYMHMCTHSLLSLSAPVCEGNEVEVCRLWLRLSCFYHTADVAVHSGPGRVLHHACRKWRPITQLLRSWSYCSSLETQGKFPLNYSIADSKCENSCLDTNYFQFSWKEDFQ